MTIQKAVPYILTFLKGFIVAAIIKFLMDTYVFDKEFNPYSLLFYSIWLGLILTFLEYRSRKKAKEKAAES